MGNGDRMTRVADLSGQRAAHARRAENARLSHEAWDRNGRKPRGFAKRPELARLAGRLGGQLGNPQGRKLTARQRARVTQSLAFRQAYDELLAIRLAHYAKTKQKAGREAV